MSHFVISQTIFLFFYFTHPEMITGWNDRCSVPFCLLIFREIEEGTLLTRFQVDCPSSRLLSLDIYLQRDFREFLHFFFFLFLFQKSTKTPRFEPRLILTSGYIGEFEYVDDHRSGKIVVQLTGRLNKCGVISPRFNVKIGDIERWTDNLLPARQFGYVILTTSAGIMDHEEARRKHVSGKILGFVY